MTGKKVYRSPQRAERFRKGAKKRTGEKFTVYRCDACGFWHIGHTLGDRKRRRRQDT